MASGLEVENRKPTVTELTDSVGCPSVEVVGMIERLLDRLGDPARLGEEPLPGADIALDGLSESGFYWPKRIPIKAILLQQSTGGVDLLPADTCGLSEPCGIHRTHRSQRLSHPFQPTVAEPVGVFFWIEAEVCHGSGWL